MKNIASILINKWNHFFFQCTNNKNLALFRIFIGITAILMLVTQYPDILDMYGKFGYFQSEIIDLKSSSYQPKIYWLTDYLETWNLTEVEAIKVIYFTFIALLLLLILGFFTRWIALLVMFFQLAFLNSGLPYVYGVDKFILSGFFYCLVLPTNAQLSIDNRIWTMKKKSFSCYTRVLQLHLCLVYFFAGFSKILGSSWRNGEAIWRQLMENHSNIINFDFLAYYPWIPTMIGWSVLVLELGYFIFIYQSKTRNIWLFSIIVLHIGIAIFLQLWFFSIVLIIYNLVAFGIEPFQFIFRKVKSISLIPFHRSQITNYFS